MTRMTVALFNYQDGGYRGERGYDFQPLQQAMRDIEPPDLILFCEGKYFRANGAHGLHQCAEALSDVFNVPYNPLPGSMKHGPMGPVIFYNPGQLVTRNWWDGTDPNEFSGRHNLACFAPRGSGTGRNTRAFEFLAWVDHWDFRSGDIRLEQARLRDRWGDEPIPVIAGGDLNGTASGPHLPQRDWTACSYRARSQKALRRPDTPGGTWIADTRAVDHLIGEWNSTQRVGGCGYHAIAEIAWRHNPEMRLLPTVNTGTDVGGGLLIDWLLVNNAMLPYVVEDSYRVHLPQGRPPSDHRLVTAALNLDSCTGAMAPQGGSGTGSTIAPQPTNDADNARRERPPACSSNDPSQ